LGRTIGIAILCLAAGLTGCAAIYAPPSVSERYDSSVDGTLVLAEALESYSRDEVLAGKGHGGTTNIVTTGWYAKVLEAGYDDAKVVDGSEITVANYCFAANSRVGCPHINAYMAHVPPELRGQLVTEYEGPVKHDYGDIVVIELRATSSHKLFAEVKRIFRRYDAWGECSYKKLDYQGLATVSPYGPPVGLWLSCEGLEQEGWMRIAAPGSMPPHVFEWRKPPSRAPGSPAK
jgi:hypothetical protein